METTTSCQVVGISKDASLIFRQMCLAEGVSASGKVRQMIEEAVQLQVEKGNYSQENSR
jgi:hypothetical protein